jgi:hypothetical protein
LCRGLETGEVQRSGDDERAGTRGALVTSLLADQNASASADGLATAKVLRSFVSTGPG